MTIVAKISPQSDAKYLAEGGTRMSARTLTGNVTSGPNFMDLVDSFVHAHREGPKFPVEFNFTADSSNRNPGKFAIAAIVIGMSYRDDSPNRVFLTVAARHCACKDGGVDDFIAHVTYDAYKRNGRLEEIPMYSIS